MSLLLMTTWRHGDLDCCLDFRMQFSTLCCHTLKLSTEAFAKCVACFYSEFRWASFRWQDLSLLLAALFFTIMKHYKRLLIVCKVAAAPREGWGDSEMLFSGQWFTLRLLCRVPLVAVVAVIIEHKNPCPACSHIINTHAHKHTEKVQHTHTHADTHNMCRLCACCSRQLICCCCPLSSLFHS